MCKTIQRLAILFALLTATGCSSLTIKSPPCTPPPLPASSVSPCPMPEPIKGEQLTMGDLYLRYLESLQQQRECQQKQANLVALVKYRDQVCLDLQNQRQSTKWWEFWR